jgi:DNA-binding transcriptional regulator PaaX
VNNWLLLVYKIPREPSAHRVGVWRKIKQLGAVLLHDAVWVLPSNARTQEQFQWLASEIEELGGEATVCVSELLTENQRPLIQRFADQADAAYKEILVALRRKDADRGALARRYQQVLSCDYFHSKLGEKVRAVLLNGQEEGRS